MEQSIEPNHSQEPGSPPVSESQFIQMAISQLAQQIGGHREALRRIQEWSRSVTALLEAQGAALSRHEAALQQIRKRQKRAATPGGVDGGAAAGLPVSGGEAETGPDAGMEEGVSVTPIAGTDLLRTKSGLVLLK